MKFFGVWAAFLSISYFLAGQGMPGGWNRSKPSTPRILENPTYTAGWAESAPQIDGIINAGEWAAALQLNIADNYTGEPVKLLLMNDWHNLYIGIIDFNDSTGIGGSDEIGFYFDLDRDGAWAPDGSEGNFWFDFSEDTALGLLRSIFPDSFGYDWTYDSSVIYRSGLTDGCVSYEISLALNGFSRFNGSFGDTVGIWLYCYDGERELFDGDLNGLLEMGLWHRPEHYPYLIISDGPVGLAERSPGNSRYALFNLPNPFREETEIHLVGPIGTPVTVKIYDASGRLIDVPIRNRLLSSTNMTIKWRAKSGRGYSLKPGIYFCEMSTPGSHLLTKMVLAD